MRMFTHGDFHGDFSTLNDFCIKYNTTIDDVLVCLGDVGINYYPYLRSRKLKHKIAKKPITLFCVHGNHEARPAHYTGYVRVERFGGYGWIDPEFPNQFFADDGEFNINGKRILVLGGAYSVDKFYRLMNGWEWFPDEQMPFETQERLLKECEGQHYDFVFSHTCPLEFQPFDKMIPGLDQNTVDKTMERFLSMIEKVITYGEWHCGHWHINRQLFDNFFFQYNIYDERSII